MFRLRRRGRFDDVPLRSKCCHNAGRRAVVKSVPHYFPRGLSTSIPKYAGRAATPRSSRASRVSLLSGRSSREARARPTNAAGPRSGSPRLLTAAVPVRPHYGHHLRRRSVIQFDMLASRHSYRKSPCDLRYGGAAASCKAVCRRPRDSPPAAPQRVFENVRA